MCGGLGLRIGPAVTAVLHCLPVLVATDRAVGFLRTFFLDSTFFGGLLNSVFLHCELAFFLRPFRSSMSARKRFISGVEVASMGLPRFRPQLVIDRGGP